jgi:hypothetical protein
MVSRTETILVDRPLSTVPMVVNRPLKDALCPTGSLPGVTGTHPLTQGDFGAPGSRRLVCLSDGSSSEKQVLTREHGENLYRFRYQVWNYTSRAAGAIHYAIGEFVFTAPSPDNTQIVRTYSFALSRDRFPGYLGRLGDFLFRISFLDRDWAEMMRNVLNATKRLRETRWSPPQTDSPEKQREPKSNSLRNRNRPAGLSMAATETVVGSGGSRRI